MCIWCFNDYSIVHALTITSRANVKYYCDSCTDAAEAQSFLLHMDNAVTEVVQSGCPGYRFQWLPHIYCDEDDLWICTLTILLDVFER